MSEAQNYTPAQTQPSRPMTEDQIVAGLDKFLGGGEEAPQEDGDATNEANAKANPRPLPAEPATEAESEPGTDAEPEAEAKPDDADEADEGEAEAKAKEDDSEETAEADDESVEVADTLDGLAEQLGVEAGELGEHLRVKVKVDGKQREVSLNEALAGFQLESNYRSKSSELAEQRRSFEQEREQWKSQAQQDAQVLTAILQNAESLIAGQEQQIDPQLREEDPERYLTLKEQSRERRDMLNQMWGYLQQQQSQQAAQFQQTQQQYVAEQAQKLSEMVPEWGKNPDQGRKEIQELREWAASEYGFTREEADQMWDARAIKAFKDLRMLKQREGKVPLTKKKLKAVPKSVKAGTRRDESQERKDEARKLRTKFKRSQNREDAVTYLRNLGV